MSRYCVHVETLQTREHAGMQVAADLATSLEYKRCETTRWRLNFVLLAIGASVSSRIGQQQVLSIVEC